MNSRLSVLAGLTLTGLATVAIAAAPGAGALTPTSAASPHQAMATYCPYQVNAVGVNVRTAPNTSATIIKQVSSPTTGLASQTVYSGSGIAWRSAFGGYVAAQFLTRISGSCAS